ncbi:MAG: adenosylmethionine decarboxylase [Rhodospirillales bacterium]|nr:adenosylmethionine decarboxylase [Rhodospirillales bacterium]MSP79441.1 adenosylmethionine decarboxylase [Rhodospirillales bacterium]
MHDARAVKPAKLVPAKAESPKPVYPVADNTNDYFVEQNGLKFAGMHLILDLWQASRLDDPKFIAGVLERAARAASATVLHTHMHHFSPNGGVSGVVVLAESHISIHTWPERNYAAIDIFMCGKCDAYLSIPVLREAFRAGSVQLTEHKRGLIP